MSDNRPADAMPGDRDYRDTPDLETNLKSRSTWMRLLFMLVLGAIYTVSRVVVLAVVLLQFLIALLAGEPNERLTSLGHALGIYTQEIIDYLTYYTEERPFPFDKDWPADD